MTSIEWTHPPGFKGESWNPVVGCTHHGAGCLNCYADELHTKRHKAFVAHNGVYPKNGKPMPAQYAHPFEVVQLMPERLYEPLRRRRPTCWFVNSVSDLFHKDVPDEFIAEAFAVMARADWHRYIILTKRAERMRDLLSSEDFCDLADQMGSVAQEMLEESEARAGRFDPNARMLGDCRSRDYSITPDRPLAHVITGVSIANQNDADRLIPILLQTPSACRAISAEPLVESVDLRPRLHGYCPHCGADGEVFEFSARSDDLQKCHRCNRTYAHGGLRKYTDAAGDTMYRTGIDWVIVGGESGPGARPFDIAWARSIIQQCKAAGVPVFVKQLGRRPHDSLTGADWSIEGMVDKKGGDPTEWPADLRIRQFPQTSNSREL